MAEPAQGEDNTRGANPLGFYKDPVTGTVQPADHPAQADAFVRQGWTQVEDPKAKAADSVQVGDDTYSVGTTKSGQTQYRRNGKIVSKDVYDKAVTSAAE